MKYYTLYVAKKCSDGELGRGHYIKNRVTITDYGYFSELTNDIDEAKKFKSYEEAQKEYIKRRKYCYNILDGYRIDEHFVEDRFFKKLYRRIYSYFEWNFMID